MGTFIPTTKLYSCGSRGGAAMWCGAVEGWNRCAYWGKRWTGIKEKDKMCIMMVTYMELCHTVLGLLGYKHHHKPLGRRERGGKVGRKEGEGSREGGNSSGEVTCKTPVLYHNGPLVYCV